METPTWMKPGIWGGVIGIAAAAIVGFNSGLIVTSGTATEQAEAEAQQAVVAALTPVCVAQFKSLAQSKRTTQLAALKEESEWMRGDFVEDQGWATFPGSEEPNSAVAEACAEELSTAAAKK